MGFFSWHQKKLARNYSKEALDAYGQYIIKMAQEENLDGHANAVKVRVQSWEKK